MSALRRAIKSSGGQVAKADDLAVAAKENQARFEKISPTMANLMALAELDTEELCGVKMKKLYEVAEYLGVQLPPDLEPAITKKVNDKELININTRSTPLAHSPQPALGARSTRPRVRLGPPSLADQPTDHSPNPLPCLTDLVC